MSDLKSASAARVLVCDDEIHISRAVGMRLGRAGFRVETADDGQSGWEAIERETPAVVVTDYQMPRLDGLALARRMRQNSETRAVPILLLTAKGFELDPEQLAAELGPILLVPKPFSPRELLALIQEMRVSTPVS